MDWLHNFFSRFTSTVRTIVSFVLPIAESHAGELIAAALPVAQQIVAGLAAQQLPGAQKRDLAVTQLKSALVSQGYSAGADLGAATLNFIIETAVSHLNATGSAAVAAAAPAAPLPNYH